MVNRCDGRLEGILDGRACGWAYDPSKPDTRLVVGLVVDGELVGETVADQMRPTLAKAGIGDGRHGFLVELPSHLCDGGTHTISVLGPGGKLLPAVSAFKTLTSPAAGEWSGTRFLASEGTNVSAAMGDSSGQASRFSRAHGNSAVASKRVRLRASRQIHYPRRLLQAGFTSKATAETIALGDHVTVQRPDPMRLAIQPAVRDPDEERSSRVSLQRDYLADRPVVTRLPGAIVDTDCFVICPTEHQYLLDSVRYHKGLMYAGYSILEDGMIERDARPIAERQEKVVVLGAQTNANYCHWLLESLVRALLFRPLDDGSWLYLTPPLSPWQRETLKLIGIGQERVLEQRRSGLMRFTEIVAVSRAMMNIYTFIPAGIDALSTLAEPTAERRRIYVSRALANVRHVQNEEDLVALLTRHGFEVAHLELLSIKDQIQLFAGAETVVGLHGAGLTNMAFSRPDTLLIELQAEGTGYGANAIYSSLASIRNHRYVQVVCPLTAGMEDISLGHRDITVDLRHLDDLLRRNLLG